MRQRAGSTTDGRGTWVRRGLRRRYLVAVLLPALLGGIPRPAAAQTPADLARYQAAARRVMSGHPVTTDSAFLAWGARLERLTPAEQRAAGADLARHGIFRLSLAQMATRLELYSRAVDRAPEARCAALWTHAPSLDAASALLTAFDSTALDAWVGVSIDAVAAELHRDPRVATDSAAVRRAVRRVLDTVDPADEPRLARLWTSDAPSPAEACWAARTVYGGIHHLTGDARLRYAAAVTTIEASVVPDTTPPVGRLVDR